jgi:hypothetical protein|tara:strand:+ start:217 stop:543 length:327 start_codon:yes stop_codon:yes gene_type:complete
MIIAMLPFLTGCTALKTAGVAGVSAGVGGLIGGPGVAAASAAIGAGATSLLTSGVDGSQCEPPVMGFWLLMGQVIETGGWLLGGVILVPLVLGYLIPNGFERKKKLNA